MLRQYKFYAKNALGITFDLGAVTVDPQACILDFIDVSNFELITLSDGAFAEE